MPQCLIRGVRSVELVATNFEEAAPLLRGVWGLQPVPSRDGARFFAAPAPITTSSACIAGRGRRSSASCSTWRTGKASTRCIARSRPRDVRSARRPSLPPTAAATASAARIRTAATSPSSAGCADHARHRRSARPAAQDRARQPQRPRFRCAACGSSPRRSASATIDENAPLWFLHCASTDHSSIVLAKTNLPTLNHVAFEMPDFDSVMRGMGRMKDNGYPIEWGPGRHGPGNNVFAYFCGPDEVPIEYTSDVLQIDERYVPRGSDYWKFPGGRSDHWGITQPRSARYYRVQRLFGFTEDGYRLERLTGSSRVSSRAPEAARANDSDTTSSDDKGRIGSGRASARPNMHATARVAGPTRGTRPSLRQAQKHRRNHPCAARS